MIYLDNAATTPVSQQVLDAMIPWYRECYGNPSSHYSIGYEAKAAIDKARQQVADALHCLPVEVYFTAAAPRRTTGPSGARPAHGGAAGRQHLITSAIEHHAVLHTAQDLEKQGYEVTYLPVDEKGCGVPPTWRPPSGPTPCLISIMAANNEIGTIQPVAELGRIARTRECSSTPTRSRPWAPFRWTWRSGTSTC